MSFDPIRLRYEIDQGHRRLRPRLSICEVQTSGTLREPWTRSESWHGFFTRLAPRRQQEGLARFGSAVPISEMRLQFLAVIVGSNWRDFAS